MLRIFILADSSEVFSERVRENQHERMNQTMIKEPTARSAHPIHREPLREPLREPSREPLREPPREPLRESREPLRVRVETFAK